LASLDKLSRPKLPGLFHQLNTIAIQLPGKFLGPLLAGGIYAYTELVWFVSAPARSDANYARDVQNTSTVFGDYLGDIHVHAPN
jgi:hypothetical protein